MFKLHSLVPLRCKSMHITERVNGFKDIMKLDPNSLASASHVVHGLSNQSNSSFRVCLTLFDGGRIFMMPLDS